MEYDLSDPTDIAILEGEYANYSNEDWQEYIDFTWDEANKASFNRAERDCLGRMRNQAGKYRKPSPKDIRYGLSIIDKIESMKEVKVKDEQFQDSGNSKQFQQVKHATFRVAWHDNKWNGTVCNNPEKNTDCSGYNSLLSERIRRNKEKLLQAEIDFRGKPISELFNKVGDISPCFWSCNIFGDKELEIQHENPAATKLHPIKEKLPPYSIFSWPFAVSFARDKLTQKADGAYPHNLEPVRIPHFQNKIKENQSIGFIYAKYSNPISAEERKYLVIGAGIIQEKGKPTKFKDPKEIIENKRKIRKYRNFPEINWALRYSLDPATLVRMPYHEYIDYIDRSDLEKKDRSDYLDKIKVAIDEPELVHCFTYVAMDIDDDQAIYVLSKMRYKLLLCRNDGVVSPATIDANIEKIEKLLKLCWNKRGYFPGFIPISRFLLNIDTPDFKLSGLLEEITKNGDEVAEKLEELIDDPTSDKNYKFYKNTLFDLKEVIEDNYAISSTQFLQLAMLNLNQKQFEKIITGKINEEVKRSLQDISQNPYLLFEDYAEDENNIDPSTGETLDFPIELFKIDIAYFPDRRYLEKVDLQRSFKNTDARRIRALIIQLLRNCEGLGHCFANAAEIEEYLKSYALFYEIDKEYKLPENFLLNVDSKYESHLSDKLKIVDANDTKYYYLQEIYNAEKEVEQFVLELLEKPNIEDHNLDFNEDIKSSVDKLKSIETFDEKEFKEERINLYSNIVRKPFFVLTGTPGSGKSHEVLNFIKSIKEKKESYLLLAPTGKAALRLSSDSKFRGIESKTIDKYINEYKYEPTKRRLYNNIIIDEMSMVDLLKFRDLLNYLNLSAPAVKRVILVGDPYQLPAIGFGKVFLDIIRFLKAKPEYKDNYIQLDVNCRHEFANSKLIDFSKIFSIDLDFTDQDFQDIVAGKDKGIRLVFWQNSDDLKTKILKEFNALSAKYKLQTQSEELLNELLGISENPDLTKIENFQILTPYRANYFGAEAINTLFQNEIKKADEFLQAGSLIFKHGDKIIRTKNMYEDDKLVLSNGSIGLIMENKGVSVYFSELEDESLSTEDIRKGEKEFFELAYCITVHKSQGSGFNEVFLIIPKKLGLLSKELIYTAITRTKQTVTVFIEGEQTEYFDKTLFEVIKKRTYTEIRKTSLLLAQPHRYYSLEPEKNVFVQSMAEYIIYRQLLNYKDKVSGFDFMYEKYPESNGQTVKIKTDFTLYILGKEPIYWEHLGLLGDRTYEKVWKLKKETYKKYGLYDRLITTDKLSGINEDKIIQIIDKIISGEMDTEDKYEKYSKYHFSIR